MGSGLRGVTSGRIDCAALTCPGLGIANDVRRPNSTLGDRAFDPLIFRSMIECHAQCVGKVGTQDVLLQHVSTLLDLLLQLRGSGMHDLVVRGAGDRSKGTSSFDPAYGFSDALLHVQRHLR